MRVVGSRRWGEEVQGVLRRVLGVLACGYEVGLKRRLQRGGKELLGLHGGGGLGWGRVGGA